MTTFRGVLHFYSETGTEGGYWAMQDRNFMGLEDEHTKAQFRCPRCGRMWDKTRDAEEPKPGFTYWHKGHIDENGRFVGQGYFGQDTPDPDGDAGPDGDWNIQRNIDAMTCYENGHAEWEPMYPEGTWSYEGLHVLRDGDKLKVFDPKAPEKELWSGEIKLVPHPLFTESAEGLWIHADQEGFPREGWMRMFMMEFPCELETQDE